MRDGSEGWTLEGVGWTAPKTSGVPVYRLYNHWTGDHHFTTEVDEYDARGDDGWTQEGIAWYSDESGTIPVYRLFNPYEQVGTHHFTTSRGEYDARGSAGWEPEGIAWYALGAGWEEDPAVQRLSKVQGWWWNHSETHAMQGTVTTIRDHMVHIINDRAYLYQRTTSIDVTSGSTRSEVIGPTSLGTVSTVGVGRNYRVTFSADPRTWLYYWWSGEPSHLSKNASGFMSGDSLVRTPEKEVPSDYLSLAPNEG